MSRVLGSARRFAPLRTQLAARTRRTARGRALRLTAGAAIVVALVWRIGAGPVVEGLRAIDAGAVMAALVIGLVTTAASAWRWCLVARSLGMRMSVPAATADCYRAVFLNSVLPAGILGDVHRAVDHGRRSGDVGRGVRAVVLERLAGQVVLMAVALGVLALRPALLDVVVPGAGRWVVAGALGVLAVAGWALRARLRPFLADARAALRPAVIGLSLLALAGYLATFVLAARVAGSTAPAVELLPLLVLALLAMSLPLNVGGWGPREAATAVGFGLVGFGAAQGLATAVVYGVLCLVACLPGGLILLGSALARQSHGHRWRVDVRFGFAFRGMRRRTAPGSPAAPVLSMPTPATVARSLPTPCTPASRGSAGAVARPRPRLLARTAA
jgi:glycosyltransferase 2 family protein